MTKDLDDMKVDMKIDMKVDDLGRDGSVGENV